MEQISSQNETEKLNGNNSEIKQEAFTEMKDIKKLEIIQTR